MKHTPLPPEPIVRPEIKGRARLALLWLAKERSNMVHETTPTELANLLILEEWQRKHPDMQFPNEAGELIPLVCTLPPLNS